MKENETGGAKQHVDGNVLLLCFLPGLIGFPGLQGEPGTHSGSHLLLLKE